LELRRTGVDRLELRAQAGLDPLEASHAGLAIRQADLLLASKRSGLPPEALRLDDLAELLQEPGVDIGPPLELVNRSAAPQGFQQQVVPVVRGALEPREQLAVVSGWPRRGVELAGPHRLHERLL